VDLDLLAFLDEERHLDLHAGFEDGDLGDAAAGRVPARAGLGRGHRHFDVRRELDGDRTAVVGLNLHHHVVRQKKAVVPDRVGIERKSLETRLIHEVVAAAIRILVRRRQPGQIGLVELLSGLERPVENGAGEQVAHLQPHEGLPAAGRGLRHVDVETVIRGVLVLEIHLPLDLDRLNHARHTRHSRVLAAVA
jgi:hypothetical protein